MANKKISQLTAKGTALAATDLVEISEDAGGGTYVTKSVTGANIKSGLQPTLVSGTNIKSINSASLLTSGNLALQTPLVSGTDIKTINSTSILGSGDLAVQPTLVSGTNIKSINTNSLVGSGDLALPTGVHILTKPISGRTYSVRTTGTAVNSSTTTPANAIALYPFIPANTLTISRLELNTTSLTVGGSIRILVYSDLNGVPSSKLLESGSLDCSAIIGPKTYNTSFTFNAGTVYWLGTYSNLGINVNIFSDTQMTPISTGSATLPFTASYYTVTAATTFPNAPSTLGTATLAQSIANLCVINLTAA